MAIARDIMTESPLVVGFDEPARKVAQLLADNQIGGVLVCQDDRLQGMITDRDLAVGIIAAGRDLETSVGELLGEGKIITCRADDPVEKVVQTMKDAAVRRLPVLEAGRLVGIISQADLATHYEDAKVGEMVGAISASPDNTLFHDITVKN
ncbi:MAG: CBS domain-containing protein [Acidimicrobiia bacterium]